MLSIQTICEDKICLLSTELWKKAQLKFSLSLERPQIVEMFIQQLTDGAEEAEGQVLNEDNIHKESILKLSLYDVTCQILTVLYI